jgi:glycosyltransferase involved in cell wall biosynthesis
VADVSIIVCTRNRADVLAACLASIEAAASACPSVETELVIVDNGSTDGTADVLRTWRKSTSLATHMLFVERPGVSRAKNTGIAAASGNILVFTDDDCRFAPDYVTKLAQAYAGADGPVLRGGRVELGDPCDLQFTIKTSAEPQEYREEIHPGGFAHGCNLTITRSVIDLVGHFDTRFGPGSSIGAGEDTEFLYRAYRAGVRILYDPSMLIFHHHGRRDVAEVRRLHDAYNVGNGAVYAKHGVHAPGVLRHLFWDFRNGFYEYWGGPLFNEEFRLRHHGKVWGNLRGALRYWFSGRCDDHIQKALQPPRVAKDVNS